MNLKRIIAALALLALAPTVLLAQSSNFSGTWRGALAGDAGPGGLEIILERDGASWKGRITLRLDGEEASPPVEDLAINGSEISFSISIDHTTLKFSGKLETDKLAGTFEGFRSGKKIGNGTMSLTRDGQMPTLHPPPSREQVADPNFDAKVAHPAFAQHGPRVMIDEAHNNFHTASGRYKPFADLISNDGYQVIANKQKFSPEVLEGADILVIANALGGKIGSADVTKPAFTDQECDVVRDWVRRGGALLLISDHAPAGAANQVLAQRFGIDMRNAVTVDEQNYARDTGNPGNIVYTRASGRLADHAITRGRNVSERINTVIAFTGQSLTGPADSFAFMKLADTAQDRMQGSDQSGSAAGRAQGIALTLGKGRMVCLGEAAMMSAQITGGNQTKFGMNYPGSDDKQLALNIMHWLSHLLK